MLCSWMLRCKFGCVRKMLALNNESKWKETQEKQSVGKHVLIRQLLFPYLWWKLLSFYSKYISLCSFKKCWKPSMSSNFSKTETKCTDQHNMLNNSWSPSAECNEWMPDILCYVFVSGFSYVWQQLTSSLLEGANHRVKVVAAKMSLCMTWNVLIEKESWGYCS